MDRNEFLSSLIGKPWRANAEGPDAFDCWHLAKYVMEKLYRIEIPHIEVPSNPDWKWMIEQFTNHDYKKQWNEIEQPKNGLLKASDGALCLMARFSQPAHIGVLCLPEKRVIHCDQRDGVIFQDLLTLRTSGWARLRFYERS